MDFFQKIENWNFQILKIANLIRLHKEGEKREPSNYT